MYVRGETYERSYASASKGSLPFSDCRDCLAAGWAYRGRLVYVA